MSSTSVTGPIAAYFAAQIQAFQSKGPCIIAGYCAGGAVAFDYGNNLRGEAKEAGFADAFSYPGFVPEYIRPLFAEGRGPFRWVALSGDKADIHRTDRLVLELVETCLYDNTPDQDFILDRRGRVVIGAGTSGHGFKFGPLLGEILADPAVGNAPRVPLDAFRLGRGTAPAVVSDQIP